jgi:hypothetical protein
MMLKELFIERYGSPQVDHGSGARVEPSSSLVINRNLPGTS